VTQNIDAYKSEEADSGFVAPDTNEVAAGRKAAHEGAVQLVGPWYRVADGFNEHVRRIAVALSRAGEHVHLQATNIAFLGDAPDEGVSDEVQKLALTDASSFRVSIQMTVYDQDRIRAALHVPENVGYAPAVVRHLRKQRVIYTVFERDDLPPGDGYLLRQAGQVWVACKDNAAAVVRAGVPEHQVKVIPCPYLPDDPLLALRGRKRKPGPPRFYHIGKWEPRKAQDNIVRAFLMAFKPGEAQLYLRCNPMNVAVDGYPLGPIAAIQRALDEAPIKANGWSGERPADLNAAIKVIDRPLPLPKLIELHSIGDVYVSLSRAEGFDMPAFDAKLAGNRLIYTETAARDFAAAPDHLVPRTGTVDAHPMYNWYGATYGDYDVAQAADAMRLAAADLFADYVPYERDLSDWSAPAVGQKMHRALKEIV